MTSTPRPSYNRPLSAPWSARRAYLLVALAAFGCDGRYRLGRVPDADSSASGGQGEAGAHAGAAAGSPAAGGAGVAGKAGAPGVGDGAAGADEPEASGGTGAGEGGGPGNEAGAAGESPEPRPLERVRWLAVQAFPSSASSQTQLLLVDLQKADWSGVTVESVSVTNALLSPDQRWVLYASYRKSETLGGVYDYYVVNTAGKEPGKRQLVLSDEPSWSACQWAPDGRRIACLRYRADVGSDAPRLALFNTSASSIGPEVDLGPLHGSPTFLGGSSLMYLDLQQEMVRLDFGLDAPATPAHLGITADSFIVSADGTRALAGTHEPSTETLVDVRTGESELLAPPGSVTVTGSFEAALSVADSADGADGADGVTRSFTFYAVNGLHLSAAGQAQSTPPLPPLPPLQLYGRSVVHVDGDGLTFTYVPPSGEAIPRAVPGVHASLQDYRLDPTGRFLYFSVGEVENGRPVPTTIETWVSRLGLTGAGEPELLTRGFQPATVAFSPDGTRLLVADDTFYDDDPQPAAMHLFTLSSSEAPHDRALLLPLNWVTPKFSRDSSYLTLLGGSLSGGARELYALDLLDTDAAPRLVLRCTSNPAPLPGCPSSTTF